MATVSAVKTGQKSALCAVCGREVRAPHRVGEILRCECGEDLCLHRCVRLECRQYGRDCSGVILVPKNTYSKCFAGHGWQWAPQVAAADGQD